MMAFGGVYSIFWGSRAGWAAFWDRNGAGGKSNNVSERSIYKKRCNYPQNAGEKVAPKHERPKRAKWAGLDRAICCLQKCCGSIWAGTGVKSGHGVPRQFLASAKRALVPGEFPLGRFVNTRIVTFPTAHSRASQTQPNTRKAHSLPL